MVSARISAVHKFPSYEGWQMKRVQSFEFTMQHICSAFMEK